MTLEIVLFVIFALVSLVSGILMVTRINPVISALFLVVNFGSLAGLYLTLNAQFIAVGIPVFEVPTSTSNYINCKQLQE